MRQKIAFVALLCLALAVLSGAIYLATRSNNLGSDFYVFWLSGRAALLEHQNPYDMQLAQQAQLSIYKHLAGAGQDQLGFAYPPFILIPILPLLLLPFAWAQAIWLGFLILCTTITSTWLFPKAPRGLSLLNLLLYPISFGILLGNFAIPIFCLILYVLSRLIEAEKHSPIPQIVCGILLAWACAKPQLVWVLIIFILFFAFKYRLRKLLYSFFICLSVYFLISFLIYPNWLTEWLPAVRQYAGYNHTQPLLYTWLAAFLPAQIAHTGGIIFAAICGLLSLFLLKKFSNGSFPLPNLLLWIGLVQYVFHPSVHSYEQVAYLAPFILFLFSSPPVGWKIALWLATLVVSWLGFAVSHSGALLAVDALPFLIFTCFFIYQQLRTIWILKN